MSEIFQHQLPNGLVLLGERHASAQSLSMTMLLPGAVAGEPQDKQGISTILTDMLCRGAGDLDAKAHSDALDQLGVHRSTSAGVHRFRLGATMIGTKFADAMPLLADMIRKPLLSASALEPSRDLALQALDALEDEPQEKVFIELRKRHYPDPFGRSSMGTRQSLQSITLEDVKNYWQQSFVPDGTILAFAGCFDWSQLVDIAQAQFGQWEGTFEQPTQIADPVRGYINQHADTSQVHIGLAYDSLPETDERSILQRAAVAVLSGGMSGRLFTEVREKRGLCYSVFAAYSGQRDRGSVLSYAGTTVPRAQETLDVLTHELKHISNGIDQDEFERAIVGMKSKLVMQGESTGARASSIAADQFILGKPRSLDELASKVDAIEIDELNTFVKDNPPQEMTIVTVGPDELKVE